MKELLMLVVGIGAGLMLRSIPGWWRANRASQAAQKPGYGEGAGFPIPAPTRPTPQAQNDDPPVLNRYSLRSRPGRRAVRKRG